ncbi:hypothetical protein [Acidomonas methanolica]|uniref:hypothetical protein n=1 Tax=Acidomonas methanolica TaxID=437 RepID=UPI002119BFF4|nr:hypothetical protein [Acidomonas methanolica]MCQ9156042.1 hypothetical protein [Acidomonas methanolica]
MIDIEDKKYSVKIMSDYLGNHGWWRAGDNFGDENRQCELVRFDDDGGYAPSFSVVLPKNEGQTFKKVWDELEQNYQGEFSDIRANFSNFMKKYESNNSIEIKR